MSEFRINGVLQASYRYDAMGRQAIRTLSSPTAVTIHSVFDSDGRRIAEYNETSGALIREYVWNGWDPIAVIEGGVISFVRADHIGRPVFATNATGVKTWTATYTPFGGVHTSTGAPPSARFPGQWFQSESGLHQNWMRDYDPTTGRYLQADPLGLVDGASVYGYAGQSPMMNVDPNGQCFGPLAFMMPACAGAAWGIAMYLAYEYIFDCGDWTWRGVFAAGATGAAYGALGGPTGFGIGWRGAGAGGAGGVAGFADDLARGGSKTGTTVDDLIKQAQEKYPSKAGVPEKHHVDPKYMGGDPKGPTVTIDGAYHQMITNAFRDAYAYGQGKLSPEARKAIMEAVYGMFPLP
jgi:RHS repeat-associated protein